MKSKKSLGKELSKKIGAGSRDMVPMSELFGKVIPDKRAKINNKWLDDSEEEDSMEQFRKDFPCDGACAACENPCCFDEDYE